VIYINEALKIAKQTDLDVLELRGNFFYLTEVINIKPIKELNEI
jgi:hypothetical protein